MDSGLSGGYKDHGPSRWTGAPIQPALDAVIAKGRLQMPVTIHDKAQSLIITPLAPTPIPEAPLFAEQKLSDGRQIWVSAPQPDRLTIVIPIYDYVYAKTIAKAVSVPEFLAGFVEHMLNPPYPIEVLGKSKFANGTTNLEDWRASCLGFGKRESVIYFSRYKHPKLGISLRLQMNPRKLGPEGFKELTILMSPWFDMASVAKAARVTSMDIAVDIVGLQVSEVIARHKKQGQRTHYIGNDGLLETVYVNRKLPPYKLKYDKWGPVKPKRLKYPAGKPLLKIYDRGRERAKYGKLGPNGDAPVTRIELVKDRFKATVLADLPLIADAFAETWVGYAPSQTELSPSTWRRYSIIARTELPTFAAGILGLTPALAKAYRKALNVMQPDLVGPQSTWAGWALGLQCTGLMQLIDTGEISNG